MPGSTLMMQVAGMGILLVVLLVAGYIVVRMVRGRLHKEAPLETFTLQDLRDLKAQGQLSDAEYDRLRSMLIGQSSMETRPAAKGSDGPPRSRI